MIGIGLTLLAGFTLGVAAVLVRMKMNASNPFSIALVITVTGNIILWPLALLFTNLGTVNLAGVLFFALAGLLSHGIARLLYLKGMKTVGAPINAAISGIFPLFSSIFAVLLLGEALTPENWIGVICILVGIILIERSIHQGLPKIEPKRILRKGLIFPLLAALCIAGAYIIRKYGLNIYNEPLFGVAVGYSFSLLLYLLLLIPSDTMRRSLSFGKNFRKFWKAGIGWALGFILSYYALSYEKVSIVTPLMQTQPLFILLFAYLFLKELDHISFELIISILLVVIGVILVSI